MKNKPSLAYQRKRPRFKSKGPAGMQRPAGHSNGGASEDEDSDTPITMEARTQEAEAAYEFAGQDQEEPNLNETGLNASRASEAPAEGAESVPAGEDQPADPAALRREQERQRRDAERERREVERKERERREAERREQQRKEQERRERERIMELRSLDVDSICAKAWEIYGAEVKEEGVELFPDQDARELSKRSFRLAEIFLLEEARLRKLRSEPLPSEPAPDSAAPASDTAAEPTMGE
jgi:ribosomal protein L9